MTQPLRIALIGERGAGKDICAQHLANYGCQKISIAHPIKAVTYAAMGACGIDTTKKGAIRKALQDAGLAARGIDDDLWVRSLIDRHDLTSSQATGYVVTDVRYKNESDMLRRVGFTMLRVEAPEEMRRARSLERGDGSWLDDDAMHPSETEQRGITADFIVSNDSDLEHLYTLLDAIVSAMTSPADEYNHV